jgi:hypothetical protein
MHKAWLVVAMMFVVAGCGTNADNDNPTSEFDAFEAYSGFMDLYWDESGGPKVLLIEHNLAYRARSDDANEWQADAVVIDGTDFFLRDAHGIGGRLLAAEESTSGATEFKVDTSRSAIYLPRTKAFPDNTEVEATVTLVGRAIGPVTSPPGGPIGMMGATGE